MDDAASKYELRRNQPVAPIRWRYSIRVQRVARLVSRVLQMSFGEFRQRLASLASRSESARERMRTEYVANASRVADALVAAAGEDPCRYISDRLQDRFLFGPDDVPELVELIREFADDTGRVNTQADEVLSGGTALLGCRFSLGSKVDWQADPVSGERCWPDSWFSEDFAISVPDADVKHVWEANRHQYLFTLARATHYTGDSRYAESVLQAIRTWIDQNPAGPGVNWCSHLEVAVRSVSWLWTLPLILPHLRGDDELARAWLASIAAHYQHLSVNLSIYTDPTNHLIGEATALWMLATVFPELPDSEENAGIAAGLIEQAILNQNHPDGVNKEQATSYHRFVLDFFLQYKLIAQKVGQPFDTVLDTRLQSMFEFASALAGQYGQAPMIGDSDDARANPLLETVGWDFREMLSTGAVTYDSADLKIAAGTLAPSTVWLIGRQAAERFDAVAATDGYRARRFFPDGGYCFLDIEIGDTSAELIFDFGDLGLWPNAAHGHGDALSVQVRVAGDWLLGDPGTGAYFQSMPVRDALRSTRAHNTVSIGGRDQSDIFGPFKWVNPYAIDRSGLLDADWIRAMSARHYGFQRLRDRIVHERIVFAVPRFGWLLVDRLFGQLDRWDAVRHYVLHPDAKCETADSGFRVTAERGDLFVLMGEAEADIRVNEQGLWSGSYGALEASTWVEIASRNDATLVSALIPTAANGVRLTPAIETQVLDNGDKSYRIAGQDSALPRVRLTVPGRNNKSSKNNALNDAAELLIDVHDEETGASRRAYYRSGGFDGIAGDGNTSSCGRFVAI